MQHLNIGIFGDKELLKKLGKQGTCNDILIYNHASSEGVFTYMTPVSEERIHPLLQVLQIIDVPVIVANEITKELAEQIVAIDAMNFESGFIISTSDDMKKIIKGTSLENFEFVEDDKDLREKLKLIDSKSVTDRTWAPIDNYFMVKSVGTVVLCVVKGGTIKKHDKLMMQPLGKEVLIKGIQSQDKDIDEAHSGMRAGFNLKGVEADELKRGYVLCKDAIISKKVVVNFKKSKFTKDTVEKWNNILLGIGTQVIAGKIEESEPLTIMTEHPIVHYPGQKCIIASTKSLMPRIIGAGTVT